MQRNYKININGWLVKISLNVFMYCHELTASKGNYLIQLECEDIPCEDSIGVTLDIGKISEKHIGELAIALCELSKPLKRDVKIFEGNKIINIGKYQQ